MVYEVDVHMYRAVKVLSIVAAGDSGYAYSTFNFWCDPFDVNLRTGSEVVWISIVDTPHTVNMKVMTWRE